MPARTLRVGRHASVEVLMGKREGRLEGELKGSRQPVLDLCEVMGIELSEARREKLGTLGLEEVEALRLHIKASRTWPERGSAKR
jgi:hypothetical protein